MRRLWRRNAARTLGRWVGALATLVLALCWLGAPEARVHPYYVVRGASFAQIHPRVLFVLDTSAAMSFRTNTADENCLWNECEVASGTEAESRISVARRAINAVAASVGERATFALMTFSQQTPRTAAGGVPSKCAPGTDEEARFTWVTSYAGGAAITRDATQNGAWRLCQGATIQPYPYLRWDELGVGSVISTDDLSGDPPASPLVDTAQLSDPANAERKVQWFPSFMGVRARLDDTNDLDHALTYATVGDWGDTDSAKDANVRDHDFYYWPYVDGFPGYAEWSVEPTSDGANYAGVIGATGVASGQLYAPFYMDLSATSIAAADSGPASRARGNGAVLTYSSPMISGGVDVNSGAPWLSTIGAVTDTPPDLNSQFSHTTVASYLKFATQADTPESCAPTSAVLLTHGVPSAGEGGGALHRALADLRVELGVKVYVVGFLQGDSSLNDMACAGAGACDGATCDTPCLDVPTAAWDTCDDPADPTNACAFLATDSDALTTVLTKILDDSLDADLASGPPSTVTDIGAGAGGEAGEGQPVQTKIAAYTEFPGWRGHVTRSLCTDIDPDTGAPYLFCTLPSPEFAAEEIEETFGPCPQSHVWDAGDCLQATAWAERRLFTQADDNTLVPVSETDGSATDAFQALLEAKGLLTSADHDVEADEIAAFLLGRDAPGGWKLAGLSNSAPVLVRRIPRHDTKQIPEIAIRDPHCAGRLLGPLDGGNLPTSLRDFAIASNSPDQVLSSRSPHRQYQEAVLVGDDMGVLHAFQYNSGNELWGFVPRDVLGAVAAQTAIGPATMGQPKDIADHIYGVSATLNTGFALVKSVDPQYWVHLGVFGLGPGGREFYALDLSHMSPEAPQGPISILWSTSDAALAATYDPLLGETWARPALSYHVPADDLGAEPDTLLVLGSGYPQGAAAPAGEGRTLILADATTGALIESAELPDITDPVFESTFGAIVDPAIGSHCLSRFWAEMQETYVADPAGRLFRWDLGRDTSHEADSVALWGSDAQAVFRFPACEGTGPDCTVDESNRGDPFIYPPAVSASNRIDDFSAAAAGSPADERDQFLVALASGSPFDDTIDGGVSDNPFHSSLYLLVDDHRSGDKHLGFNIPAGAPKGVAGDIAAGAFLGASNPSYMRVALSDIERTRTVIPYPGADSVVETRTFSKAARPIAAPQILVTGVVDREAGLPDVVIEGIEAYFVQFTIFEPGSAECDPDFYDSSTGQWHFDSGSTYVISFRLTSDATSGFNFTSGTTSTDATFEPGFTPGLTLSSVEQVSTAACPDGNCGAQQGVARTAKACDNNVGLPPAAGTRFALGQQSTFIGGFSPAE